MNRAVDAVRKALGRQAPTSEKKTQARMEAMQGKGYMVETRKSAAGVEYRKVHAIGRYVAYSGGGPVMRTANGYVPYSYQPERHKTPL